MSNSSCVHGRFKNALCFWCIDNEKRDAELAADNAKVAALEAALAAMTARAEKAEKERDEALARLAMTLLVLKGALRPLFEARVHDWNRLRRIYAWAKRAAHPGLAWPEDNIDAILKDSE